MINDGDRRQEAPPVHFLTIVLNGMPFIRYHIDVFKRLPFDWHWHVVEGVAELAYDTAWWKVGGGRITDALHDGGWSKDGTPAYLDELAAALPDRVRIYRKPRGVFWDGKRQMVSAPLPSIAEECLLWQVDADELWTAEAIGKVRARFIAEPQRTAAWYWCHYFVGERLIIATRYNYAQNPRQEWLRTWRYRPGARWSAHAPPVLVAEIDGRAVDLGQEGAVPAGRNGNAWDHIPAFRLCDGRAGALQGDLLWLQGGGRALERPAGDPGPGQAA